MSDEIIIKRYEDKIAEIDKKVTVEISSSKQEIEGIKTILKWGISVFSTVTTSAAAAVGAYMIHVKHLLESIVDKVS